jgi:hypothetical protein
MEQSAKDNPDIDIVTNDENNYDQYAATRVIDYIYDKTQHNIFFQQLYDVAASKMLSTDRGIGLAVLFSYDYLYLFHKCIVLFYSHPNDFIDSNEHYIRMYDKIK